MNEINEIKDETEMSLSKSPKYSPRFVNIHCVNCGRLGHKFNDCNEPIISLGIIAIYDGNRHNEYNDIVVLSQEHKDILKSINCKCNKRELKPKTLLVQRKHTMGHIDFVRCKYPKEEPERSELIRTLLSEMTSDEIHNLRTKTFDEIWDNLWIDLSENPKRNVSDKRIPYYVQDRGICQEMFEELDKKPIFKRDRNTTLGV